MNIIKFIVATFLAFLLPYLINAEGVKQLTPDSTYKTCLSLQPGNAAGQSCFGMETCDADHKLYVHIDHPGEKIYLGFGWSDMVPGNLITVNMKLNGVHAYGPVNITPGSMGHIEHFSEANAGPDVLDANGYKSVSFAPAASGDYEIYFDTPTSPGSNILLSLFDVTVVDTAIAPLMAVNGRLWAKNWTFKSFNIAFPEHAFRGTLNVYTEDSVVTSVFFNSMQGDYFDVSCNSNGCYSPPIPWDSSCKSAIGKHGYSQYKIFVNNPDSICYPTGMTGNIAENSISVIPSCDGSFNIFFSSGKAGRVKAVFDVNPSPGIQPEDVVLIDSVTAGLNTLFWNGLSGLQQPLPAGTQIVMTLCLISGLTNLPVFDVERHLKGFVITQVRPPGSSIASYWNDTLLASNGGQRQLTGCYSYDTIGCHGWDGNYNHIGIGSYNTVNTWWYASGNTTSPIILTVQKKPDTPIGIIGLTTFCQSAVNTYTVVPNPLPGADANNYEWELTDDATSNVLLTLPNQGASATIPFSLYPPGNMHLKVRGVNTLCGYGSFGPAASGEGIQLHVNPAPHVTNTDTSLTICSGENISINLQSSLPGTTWSYTATATSGFVSGYYGGAANPIDQTLFNTGIEADSVVYRVVPYALSCNGDTADFYVAVNIGDSVNVSISGSGNNVCFGTTVTYTATPANPGSNPSFQWKVNGINAGSNASAFAYIPANGEIVTCILTSSNTVCSSNNPATSNSITMVVNPLQPVSVSISPSSNPVCAGTQVSFTAVPVNGGIAPQYQWKVNGLISGTNSPAYSYVPANGDSITCTLTSNVQCPSGNPALSNEITMTVNPILPVGVS
ncbi:MAG: PKD-like domain-containing protein, partial [Bacteroidota bacterium]